MKLPLNVRKLSNKGKGLLFIVSALICGFLAVVIILSIGSKMSPSVVALEAVKDIAPGDPLDRSMFKEVKLAEANLPTKLVDPNIDFTGLIAAKHISVGDIFREPAILSLEESNLALFSARLRALNNPELRAVEIPTKSVEGLITGMGSNDKVDIIAVYEEIVPKEEFVVAEDALSVKTIIRGAPVIGVKTGDAEGIEESPATVLIVALTEEQAETFALYNQLGTISCSLRPFGINDVEEQESAPQFLPDNNLSNNETQENANETVNNELVIESEANNNEEQN